MTIFHLFQQSVQRWGKRPFLVEGSRRWTYQDIYDQVEALRPQYPPHHRILHAGPNSVSLVSSFLATSASGAVFVPLSPDLPREKQHAIVSMVNFQEPPKGWHTREKLALLLFTSGTTAMPKGVLLSEQNILSNLAMIDQRIPKHIVSEHDQSYAFLPWCHSYGLVGELLFLMSRGASLVLPQTRDPRRYIAEIRQSRPTVLFTVPRFLEKVRHVCQTTYWFLPSFVSKRASLGDRLRFMSVGGAAIRPETLLYFREKWGVPVFQGYGLTETGPMISLCGPEETYPEGSCGRPLQGVEVQSGEQKELWVKSPSVCQGYLGPDNTVWRPREKFLENGWFSTGDAFRWENEHLFFEHRRGGLWKLPGGKFVDPVFLEKTVLEIEGVEQACLLGNGKEKLGLAVWSSSSPRPLDLERVQQYLEQKGFQPYEWPQYLVFLKKPLLFEEGTLSLKQEPIRHEVERILGTSLGTSLSTREN